MKSPRTQDVDAEFVCRETCARRCEVSVGTWDQWVRDGYVPKPVVERGQIKRWHWPQVVGRFTSEQVNPDNIDPFMQGVANANQKARGRVAPR
jgi:hypothetical protein